jgi:hypothetical protein
VSLDQLKKLEILFDFLGALYPAKELGNVRHDGRRENYPIPVSMSVIAARGVFF